MKKNIIFRMVAYTDAAGKFSLEAPRNGNEDNFFFAYDLSKEAPSKGEPDVDTPMSDCGLLMVVADGMGGMNAGEVASQIAVDTVAEYFASGKINPALAKDHQKRKKYMERVISEADVRIKKDSKHETEHKGMGSTIIMAWIVDDELTLSWCGDSRAYRYNPAGGIELLSKDHSYVQELVNKGIIKYEDTFDHPQGNIVTRSLGDVSKKVIPETELFKVYNDDIIMLCSDGLSGVLRDKKTYDMDGELIDGDNLEDIISTNRKSLKECREALWKAAEKADWYDNVTAVLCEIRSGAGTYVPTEKEELLSQKEKTQETNTGKTFKGINIHLSTKGIIFSIIGILVFICTTFFAAWTLFSDKVENGQQVAKADSVRVEKDYFQGGNKGLNFVNAQTMLKTKLADIQEALSLPQNDSNISHLADLIETAKDTIELSNVKKKIELLEYKVPYLKIINKEKANNASNRAAVQSLNQLYDKIMASNKIEGENWKKEIQRILNTKGIETNPKTGGVAENGSEITEIPERQDDEKIHEARIQRNDTYDNLISFLENKYPGYYVAIIIDKNTERTLYDWEYPDNDIDIKMAIGHNVKIILKRIK